MRRILLNKNQKVLTADYDGELGTFNKIYDIENIDYAPLIIKRTYQKNKNIRAELSEWFKGRGIPSLRDDLDLLLAKLGVTISNRNPYFISYSMFHGAFPYPVDLKYI